MTEGNVKNIRPRYLVALAIMALACAAIVTVSIRSSDENARIGAFSDALAHADEKVSELANSAGNLSTRTGAARNAVPSALDFRIATTTDALDALDAAWRNAPDGLKAAIAEKTLRDIDADPFKLHRDLIVQANQIFGGGEEAENYKANRLASTYTMINQPMRTEYEDAVREYSKNSAEAVTRFNYGIAAAVAVMLVGIGLFIFLPMERTIRRQMVQMSDTLDEVRAVGRTATRARSALNDASSATLIVGTDGVVEFANKAMRRLAGTVADELADELDGFAVLAGRSVTEHGAQDETGVGSQEDQEAEVNETAGSGEDGPADHEANEPDAAASVLSDLTGLAFDSLHALDVMKTERLLAASRAVTARMAVGGHTLEMTASPVFDETGERLGSVVEWTDMTDRVAVEREIAEIVHSAGEGDFTKRLTEADKDGFMADLARGMNEVLDVVDNGLSQTVRVISALAEGDLTERMRDGHKGAFARLKDDVDRMAGQIETMLGRIAHVSAAVQSTTKDISSGIADLSMRTEHQASSLEETTASMEELSATVRQNAENAQEANEVAAAAREAAVSGGEVTGRAVGAMVEIEASSKKITDIVGLIQEIAFQTNLLALNASVEAARAGEAGRGFSVVANEVRALAQRSASASKDIRELITNSDSQVKEGVRLVNEAGTALEEIVNSVRKVADYVSDIASASQEQTGGIEQVSGAISGMDEMTQQNAALVEETRAALQSARVQTDDLQIAVGAFRMSENGISDRGGESVREAEESPARALHDMVAKMARPPAAGKEEPSDGSTPGEEPEWEVF